MQHLLRDGRGVREEVDFRRIFLSAKFGDQEFHFLSDDNEGVGGSGAVEYPLNGALVARLASFQDAKNSELTKKLSMQPCLPVLTVLMNSAETYNVDPVCATLNLWPMDVRDTAANTCSYPTSPYKAPVRTKLEMAE